MLESSSSPLKPGAKAGGRQSVPSPLKPLSFDLDENEKIELIKARRILGLSRGEHITGFSEEELIKRIISTTNLRFETSLGRDVASRATYELKQAINDVLKQSGDESLNLNFNNYEEKKNEHDLVVVTPRNQNNYASPPSSSEQANLLSLVLMKKTHQQQQQQQYSPHGNNNNNMMFSSHQNYILNNDARRWKISITCATIRHGKVEYEIQSEFLSPTASGTSIVRRRYRDFCALEKALIELASPFAIVIPSLPPKNALSVFTGKRGDVNLVASRRLGLSIWLNYVCNHNALRMATALREFLWETETSALTGFHTDMNVLSEKALWHTAIENQKLIMEARFINSVTSLTAMNSHLKHIINAYDKCNARIAHIKRLDGRFTRARTRTANELQKWAQFETNEAGQNFLFMEDFTKVLSFNNVAYVPKDDAFNNNNKSRLSPIVEDEITNFSTSMQNKTNNNSSNVENNSLMISFLNQSTGSSSSSTAPSSLWESTALTTNNRKPISTSSMVSQSGNNKTILRTVEEVARGNLLEVNSVNLFSNILSFWSENILSKLAGNKIDPRMGASQNLDEKQKAINIACEWTQMDYSRPEMMQETLLNLVRKQTSMVRGEISKWEQVKEALMSENAEFYNLSSLLDHDNISKQMSNASSSSSPPPPPSRTTSNNIFDTLDSHLDKQQQMFESFGNVDGESDSYSFEKANKTRRTHTEEEEEENSNPPTPPGPFNEGSKIVYESENVNPFLVERKS